MTIFTSRGQRMIGGDCRLVRRVAAKNLGGGNASQNDDDAADDENMACPDGRSDGPGQEHGKQVAGLDGCAQGAGDAAQQGIVHAALHDGGNGGINRRHGHANDE